MKIGDKVRFLNEIGGGIVTGFRGKDIVLVEDADGFDIPMPIRECVVIDTDDYNMTRPVPKATPKKVEEKPVRSSVSRQRGFFVSAGCSRWSKRSRCDLLFPILYMKKKKWDICLSLKFLLFVSRKCVVGMC